MTEAWTVKVRGRVQGVGYRYSAQRQARMLGVSGWVRNEYDGSVKLFVQGEGPDVARFLSWLSRGPSMAVVTEVIKIPAAPDDSCRRFDITF